jgi:outer membrane protein TolC
VHDSVAEANGKARLLLVDERPEAQSIVDDFLRSSDAGCVLVAAPAAHADSFDFARTLLQADDKGGGSAPAPAPTLGDLTGPATPVTLPDLLVLAVRQAPALELAKIDIEIAEAQIEQARGIEDWSAAADLSVRRNVSTLQQGTVTFSSTDTIVDATGSMSKVFGWGGRLSIDGESRYKHSTDDMGSSDQYLDTITATYVEPILDGRGSDVVRSAVAQARIARDSAALLRTQSAIGVVRDVVSAYWELVFAQRDLEIRKSSLDLANERLRRTQAGIKGGGLARTEALEVELVVATRQEEVIGAELTVVDRSIELRRLVGMEIGPKQLALSTSTDLDVPSQSWDLDALLDNAFRTSPELALLTEQGKNATIEVEVTENGILPTLDLSVSAGPVGIDDSAYGAAKNMVVFDDYGAGLTLSYRQSIGNNAATGAARAARAQRQKIKIDETDARAQIAQSLTQAVLLAEAAVRRVEIAGKAIELAQQNIVAEQSRYSLGKSTNFDVLLRQDELKQAQLRESRAIIDWHKASTVIAAIDGDVLAQLGITLDEK